MRNSEKRLFPLFLLLALAAVVLLQGSDIRQPNDAANLGIFNGAPTFNERMTVCMANGTSTYGCPFDQITGCGGSYGPNGPGADQGVTIGLTTGAVSGNDSGVFGNVIYRFEQINFLRTKIRLTNLTERRDWTGFTNQGCTTMTGSDDPAGHYAGFAFCNDTGANCTTDDTNFQCVTKDGTTQDRQDTGVAVDTNEHVLEIRVLSASVECWIDGGLTNSMSSNLPTGTIAARAVIGGVETETAANRTALLGWHVVVTDR